LPRKRTFLDTNVLINAFRGTGKTAAESISLLQDDTREFVTSDFLRLELLPKARFHKNQLEVDFYERFFQSAAVITPSLVSLVLSADAEATIAGLGAVDALHVAAAKAAGAEELITAERPTSPLFRVTDLKIISIYFSPTSP